MPRPSSSAACSSRNSGFSAPDPDSGSPEPLGVEAFAARLADCLTADECRGRLALAVSGGPDSLAMMLLAGALPNWQGPPPLVLHVDHGLRPTSGAEARQVAAWADDLGLECRVLTWRGAKPVSGLQAAARHARWELLVGACRAAGVGVVLMAHHREDQAETLLQRVDRASGPDGLAAMRRRSRRDGMTLARPLLEVPKARLIATCLAAGLRPIDDPSNRDGRFARGRLRGLAADLAAEGVTTDRLARFAMAMGGLRDEVDRRLAEWAPGAVTLSAWGTVRLDRGRWAALPEPIGRRALADLLRLTGGAAYPPRGHGLDRLIALLAADRCGRVTLAGCVVTWSDEAIVFEREGGSIAGPVMAPDGVVAFWDRRFEIRNASGRPVRVGAAGEQGMRRWRLSGERGTGGLEMGGQEMGGRAAGIGRRETPRGRARLTLPAVCDLDGTLVLPHLSEAVGSPFGWVGDAVKLRFRPRSVPDWIAWLEDAREFNRLDAAEIAGGERAVGR